jgi:predicted O-methyltransferase YrrM
LKRRFKDFAKIAVAFGHRTALRAGIVVLPNHYYTPIADANELQRTRSIWARRSSMIGIDVDIPDQSAALRSTVKPFEPEFRGNKAFLEGSSKGFGPGFGYIEAQCLHGVLRTFKPRKVIEVGSGVSTYCAMQACTLNAQRGNTTRITCIEPNPRPFLRTMDNQGISLIESPVQSIDPAFFLALDAGDLLFIDSTHAVKPGGDVLYLYLEVLPRLKPGVLIHIHDIFFPFVYQPDLLTTLYQWSETALLQALLTHNSHLSVLFCLSQLHYDAPDILAEVFPEYVPRSADGGLFRSGVSGHFPSSIYLRTA